MKKQFIHFIFIFCVHVCLAQDPLFKNSNQSLIYLNPSFSGSNGNIRNQFSYRSQWYNLSGSYVTYLNNVDAYIKKLKGGIALTALVDDQGHGTLKTSVVNLTYAQYISLLDNKFQIIPSVQIGYPRRGFVWNTTGQLPGLMKRSYIDISSGLLITASNFFGGISLNHINEPDEGLLGYSRLPLRTNLHASYNFITAKGSVVNLSILGIKQQNFYYSRIQIHALFFKHFIVGTGYTNNHGVLILAGYKHKYFSTQIGYDLGISRLSGNTASSFELHLSFNLRRKTERDSLAAFERW